MCCSEWEDFWILRCTTQPDTSLWTDSKSTNVSPSCQCTDWGRTILPAVQIKPPALMDYCRWSGWTSPSAFFMKICDFSSGPSSAGRPDPEQQTATPGRGGRSDRTCQKATTSPPERDIKHLVMITEHMVRSCTILRLNQGWTTSLELNITPLTAGCRYIFSVLLNSG